MTTGPSSVAEWRASLSEADSSRELSLKNRQRPGLTPQKVAFDVLQVKAGRRNAILITLNKNDPNLLAVSVGENMQSLGEILGRNDLDWKEGIEMITLSSRSSAELDLSDLPPADEDDEELLSVSLTDLTRVEIDGTFEITFIITEDRSGATDVAYSLKWTGVPKETDVSVTAYFFN
jgi:hypothetical protein